MDPQKKSRALLKGTGIYAIGTLGTKMLSFFIVPLYTYYITTEDMGLYDILLTSIQLLAPIITMQVSDAAFRYIIRSDEDPAKYIRNTMHVLIVNCSVAFSLVFVVDCFHSIPYCTYFALLLVLTRIMDTIQKLLRALKNQMLFAISGIIYSVVFFSLNIIQICIFKRGVSGLLISGIIANLVSICVIFAFEPNLRINYLKKTNFTIVKKFYKFSAPLVPNYLNWWAINSSDRYIVATFLGHSANGILAIAHKFPTVLQMVLNLFTTSWQDLSVAEKDKECGDYNSRLFKFYYCLSMSFMWILMPATKVIIHIVMSSAYKTACDYVSFYYLGTLFQSYSSFYGVGYLRNKKTWKAFSTSIYGAIINIVINIALIKVIGLQAAAVSTFIGFLVMWFIRERQNHIELNIKINALVFIPLLVSDILVAVLSINLSVSINCLLTLVCLVSFLIFNNTIIKTVFKRIVARIHRKK